MSARKLFRSNSLRNILVEINLNEALSKQQIEVATDIILEQLFEAEVTVQEVLIKSR